MKKNEIHYPRPVFQGKRPYQYKDSAMFFIAALLALVAIVIATAIWNAINLPAQ